jgi:hypothetical protein
MSEQNLPAPVARAIDAVNARNTDAFLSEFVAGGWIDDNGRQFSGRDAMRHWSDDELIGAGMRFAVMGGEATVGGLAVDMEVVSDGFNGHSRFTFGLEGEALGSMTITP